MRACSVRTPRSVRKLSNGAPVTPSAFAHQARSSPTAASRAITAPLTTSLCPFRYFVVEWTTMSAPSGIGLWSAGERKVLSTTTSAPSPCAASATRAMSVIRSSGLLGVSSHTTDGACSARVASTTSLVRSANTTVKCPRADSARSSRCVPP